MNDDVKDGGTGSQVPETVELQKEVEPGEKTDPKLLLKSLQEEREEKRLEREARIAAEEALIALQQEKGQSGVQDIDPEDALQRVAKVEDQLAVRDLQETFPALKENVKEFDEFRQAYPGVRLESVAKLFISEKNLVPSKERPGLEKQSSSGRQAPPAEVSQEEIASLRNNNFRKYSQLVREGKIKP